MSEQKVLKFPKNFLWGVSTSAYQIEGGAENDWSRREKTGGAKVAIETPLTPACPAGRPLYKGGEDFICGQACDSYHRYEEDLDLVKNLHCGAYRIGLEWARIEPRPGEFDQAEIEHYRQVLLAFKKRGIKSVVTLWHWTNPLWLADSGGWANREVVKHLARYTEIVAQGLGDLIDYWLTINEPMVYLLNSYVRGKWPPQKKNIFLAWRVWRNLIKAHRKAYSVIHQGLPEAKVGLTMLTNYFAPARRWCPAERLLAGLANYFWNDCFVCKLAGQYDFLGLDYYFHDRIIWYPPFVKNLNTQITDMGWEIYPRGIYQVLKNYQKFGVPLYIMENGLADATDSQRAQFIIEHLKYLHQAIKDGVDARGYFHWSLLDNFEWSEGFGPKFGLYAVDRRTLARWPRPSAGVYAEICQNNEIRIE
jgi:beta-glucosidase